MAAKNSVAHAARRSAEPSLLSDDDLYLFNEGTHCRLYEKLGAHPLSDSAGESGTYFAVWAPDAQSVSVIGDFNDWDGGRHPLRLRAASGIWEGFVRGVGRGAVYKYKIASRHRRYSVEKADPFAQRAELPPRTASVVWAPEFDWSDGEWMRGRGERNALTAAQSVYEVHLGSWMRRADGGWMGYRELGEKLAEYAADMGFTHVELLPVMEHPFYGSWGYQTTGYFAATSRYGEPEDLMWLVDRLHRAGVGVLFDWVPSHFPRDQHGLSFFDGTHLFEHADPRQGLHPDWDSLIFNYGRNEVRSFLLSSAFYWLEKFHADGLRVDAVASMLYLDYSRRPGEWIPNQFGGRENLAAVDFLRRLNQTVYDAFPDVQTVAEESTAWPMVSRPVHLGGLGFGLKWDMGWMHDTLAYLSVDPVYRKYHQDALTFRQMYAYQENFVLPLSHDEVVHGKGSLLGKMPGDAWRRLANLRLLYGYMYTQPGKKLLFMGGEIGQWAEWSHEGQLEWPLLDDPGHAGVQRWVRDLNRLYCGEACLHELDCSPGGFEWIDCHDSDQSTLSYLRRGRADGEALVVVLNFTPVPRHRYRVGVPWGGRWTELLNGDAAAYGGSGQGNFGSVEAVRSAVHGRPWHLELTLPPLAMVVFKGAR